MSTQIEGVKPCSSAKRGYHSRTTAMRDARFQMGKRQRVILRVYRCEECKQWHMTSTPHKQSYQTLKYLRMRHEVQW